MTTPTPQAKPQDPQTRATQPLRAPWLWALALLCWWAGAGQSMASPPLLMGGIAAPGVRAVGGWPELGLAVWPTERWGVSLQWRLPAASLGVASGARWRAQSSGGWYAEGQLSGGLSVPLLQPGLVVGFTPGAEFGIRHPRFGLWLGLRITSLVRVTPPVAAVFPARLALGISLHLGAWQLGVEAAAGADLQPERLPAAAFQLSGFLSWQMPALFQHKGRR